MTEFDEMAQEVFERYADELPEEVKELICMLLFEVTKETREHAETLRKYNALLMRDTVSYRA